MDLTLEEYTMSTRPALTSIALLLLITSASANDGLVAPDSSELWPQWQARITVSTSILAPVALTDAAAAPRSTRQLGGVLGDYYFNTPGLRLPASTGGLRATGGLLTSTRGFNLGPALGWRDANNDASAAAYLGVGYTGHAIKGGWGITADLGLAAEGTGATNRLGRALFGNQGFDNTSRELRLSPVLQLGLSYAF
jgi:hypothetical protein